MKRSLITFLMLALVCVLSISVFAAENEGHWAQADMERMEEEEVIENASNPDNFLTRGEFVQMIVNLFEPTQTADLSSFKDISKSSPYYDAFSKAYAMGAIKGFSDTELGPNAFITREQAMVIYDRILDLSVSSRNAANKYTDSDEISSWAKDAVAKFTVLGFVNGYEDGSVRPEGYITLAESSKILNRAVAKIIKEPGKYDASDIGNGVVLVKAEDVALTNVDPDKVVVTDKKVKESLKVEDKNGKEVALDDVVVVSELEPEEETNTTNTNTSSGNVSSKPHITPSTNPELFSGDNTDDSGETTATEVEIILSSSSDDTKYDITVSGEIADGNLLTVTIDNYKVIEGVELSASTYVENLKTVVSSEDLNVAKILNTLTSSYNDEQIIRDWGYATIMLLPADARDAAFAEEVSGTERAKLADVYAAIKDIEGIDTEIKRAAASAVDTVFTNYETELNLLKNLNA